MVVSFSHGLIGSRPEIIFFFFPPLAGSLYPDLTLEVNSTIVAVFCVFPHSLLDPV